MTRIYIVRDMPRASSFTDDRFIRKAERQGYVWTLQGYAEQMNKLGIQFNPDTDVMRIIAQKQEITIPLSEEDLQQLNNGETFDWSFPDQNDIWIDVIVKRED